MLEEIYNRLMASRRTLCPVGNWIETLDEADQDRMRALLVSELSSAELVRQLHRHIRLSESSMRRHRARVNGREGVMTLCSCS